MSHFERAEELIFWNISVNSWHSCQRGRISPFMLAELTASILSQCFVSCDSFLQINILFVKSRLELAPFASI
jgi:hypothetical protein